MSYFVAEDQTHVRYGRGGYVSVCGWDYPPDGVVWAGEYAPAAYDACSECQLQGAAAKTAAADLVVVQGVYAVGDDAHLWIRRSPAAWHSVCGRTDMNHEVAWADSEWPEAYDACAACVSLVDEDLWQPDADVAPLAEPSDTDLYQAYRVWVIQDGIEHRASDSELAAAMCGQTLRAGATPQDRQSGGTTHCHACDSAVGRARAGLPPKPTKPVMQPVDKRENAAKRTKGRPKAAPRSGAKRQGVATASAPSRPKRTSGSKDVALYGRKMVVPFRLVRGGAPGLGRRR